VKAAAEAALSSADNRQGHTGRDHEAGGDAGQREGADHGNNGRLATVDAAKRPGTCQMNEPKKSRPDWRLILVAFLAAAFMVLGIAYKYTGDFTGGATFGTSGRISSPQ
jgi:hypothetical protein